jgi:CDP-glycerol glycerophosphotransferase
VETTDALTEAILTYDAGAWQDKYDAFAKRFNHADDGTASEKVAVLIEEKIDDKSI